MEQVVISGIARTAGGSYGGSLATKTAPELGGVVIREAVRRAGVEAATVDEVLFGSGWQAGIGPNMARMSAIAGGLSVETPATTINMRCGSSLKALTMACAMIRAEDNRLMIAGGAESTSNIPYLAPKMRWGARMGDAELVDDLTRDGFFCQLAGMPMSGTAELLTGEYGFGREEQDAYALLSHQRAVKAIAEGRFKEEIVPVEVETRKEKMVFDTDEIPRGDIDLAKLAKLHPIVSRDGCITAGNSSALCDGASAAVLSSRSRAKELGLQPLALIRSYATIGMEPLRMGLGPVAATRQALEKAGLKLSDIDLIEMNEAFAVQYLAVEKELGLDRDKVNLHGGAIALGHPIGGTAVKLLATLLSALKAYDKTLGLVTLCINGGHGMALVVERL